ncbi:MAG: hypothetical protein JNG88_00735 [Phycisphaerales bacterium]|nr:hypothetical protein [Phycisphaerales bacterium]
MTFDLEIQDLSPRRRSSPPSRRITRRTYANWLIAAVLVAAVFGCESAAPRRSATVMTAAKKQCALDSFDKVWTTIRDKHWDPKLGGVDWDAVRAELRPRAEAATTTSEVREAISEMIHRLKLSHYGIIPVEAYEEMADATGEPGGSGSGGGTRQGWAGIEARVIGGQALVSRVYRDSAAARAGVMTGMALIEVNGVSVDRRVRLINDAHKDSTLLDLFLTRGVENMLSGEPGGEIKITALDARDARHEFQLALGPPHGESSSLGNMGVVRTWFESGRIGDDIGYIRFNMFANPGKMMKQFEGAMRSFSDVRGVILDLRGNPGGVGAMAMGMAGWFVTEPATLGTMITRETKLKFAITPRATPFGGPLAVLVDGGSASTAEILAGGLQDIGRARVFGQRSAGAALPSVIERLPNGDGFQYAFANYISASDKPLEGRGVIPEESVVLTRSELLAGRDDVISAAEAWIRKQ